MVSNAQDENRGLPTIAAIVMTGNEIENIRKCLDSLVNLDRVFVLDSGATDGTTAVARDYTNVQIVPVKWRGFAQTFNFGAEIAKQFTWIIRVDSDEELVGDLKAALRDQPNDVAGVALWRQIYFLGAPLRYGPHSKLRIVRVIRGARGRFEDSAMDEHMLVDGNVEFVSSVKIIDNDLKPFSKWLTKTIQWAKLEATNTIQQRQPRVKIDRFNQTKRLLKFTVYYRTPPYMRAFMYFLYRFLIQRECLGGRVGISWCVLQGLWYRLLVDFFLLYPDLIDRE